MWFLPFLIPPLIAGLPTAAVASGVAAGTAVATGTIIGVVRGEQKYMEARRKFLASTTTTTKAPPAQTSTPEAATSTTPKPTKPTEEGPVYLANPPKTLQFKDLIPDEDSRRMVAENPESGRFSVQFDFGTPVAFETGPHLLSPDDIESYNSTVENDYLNDARLYITMNRETIRRLVVLQHNVNNNLDQIFERRQAKIDKNVLTKVSERNFANLAASAVRNVMTESDDARGEIYHHLVLAIRTLRRVAFMRVIKRNYPRKDDFYRILLNFPLTPEELRFVASPSVENIPDPLHLEPIIENQIEQHNPRRLIDGIPPSEDPSDPQDNPGGIHDWYYTDEGCNIGYESGFDVTSSEDSDSESEMEVDENPNLNQVTPKPPSVTTTEKPKKVYCSPTGSKNIPSPMKK